MEEQTQVRNINQLIDLPYSEMSDEEIETVIEWKSRRKAESEYYQQQLQQTNDALQNIADSQMQQAQFFENKLQELTAHALDLYNEVSGNV